MKGKALFLAFCIMHHQQLTQRGSSSFVVRVQRGRKETGIYLENVNARFRDSSVSEKITNHTHAHTHTTQWNPVLVEETVTEPKFLCLIGNSAVTTQQGLGRIKATMRGNPVSGLKVFFTQVYVVGADFGKFWCTGAFC